MTFHIWKTGMEKAYPEQPEKLKADAHKLKERIKDKLNHK